MNREKEQMKKIESIIRPDLVEQVKKALGLVGVSGITLTEVVGHGRQRGHTEIYRGVEYQIDSVPKVKLEVVVPEDLVEQVIQEIAKSARTGQFGDGKIFVAPIEDAVRIRTGEHGDLAL